MFIITLISFILELLNSITQNLTISVLFDQNSCKVTVPTSLAHLPTAARTGLNNNKCSYVHDRITTFQGNTIFDNLHYSYNIINYYVIQRWSISIMSTVYINATNPPEICFENNNCISFRRMRSAVTLAANQVSQITTAIS